MNNDTRRKTLRLHGFDYASAGSYFVTICLHQRRPIFGTVSTQAIIELTDPGAMILNTLEKLPDRFASVGLDEYIVMPDHLHAIIHLGIDPGTVQNEPLGSVMKLFKTMSTNWYIRGVKELGWPGFDRYFWQKNYYDRFLRNDQEVMTRREYIANNPSRWLESRKT